MPLKRADGRPPRACDAACRARHARRGDGRSRSAAACAAAQTGWAHRARCPPLRGAPVATGMRI
eukprot:7152329-Prymnesium_polylepis.1